MISLCKNKRHKFRSQRLTKWVLVSEKTKLRLHSKKSRTLLRRRILCKKRQTMTLAISETLMMLSLLRQSHPLLLPLSRLKLFKLLSMQAMMTGSMILATSMRRIQNLSCRQTCRRRSKKTQTRMTSVISMIKRFRAYLRNPSKNLAPQTWD